MDVIGGGVLVAAAAALWIAYLLPSWLRRRQYLDTERNAVRLQQTLRILAETAETPEAVRVEATAREVASQQRILHEHEQAARLAAEAAENLAIVERRAAEDAAEAARGLAAAARATVTEPIATIPTASPTQATAPQAGATGCAGRRDGDGCRAGPPLAAPAPRLCSLLLLASLLTVVGGLVAAAFGASLLIAGGGALGIVVAFAGLVRLARVRVPAVAAAPVAVPESTPFEPIELAEPEADDHGGRPSPCRSPSTSRAARSPRWRWRRSRRRRNSSAPRRTRRWRVGSSGSSPWCRRSRPHRPPYPRIFRRRLRPPRHPIAGPQRPRARMRAWGSSTMRAPRSTTSTPCCVVVARRAEPLPRRFEPPSRG